MLSQWTRPPDEVVLSTFVHYYYSSTSERALLENGILADEASSWGGTISFGTLSFSIDQ
jgi:hypothetical protein